jgi:hypothetical protein
MQFILYILSVGPLDPFQQSLQGVSLLLQTLSCNRLLARARHALFILRAILSITGMVTY